MICVKVRDICCAKTVKGHRYTGAVMLCERYSRPTQILIREHTQCWL